MGNIELLPFLSSCTSSVLEFSLIYRVIKSPKQQSLGDFLFLLRFLLILLLLLLLLLLFLFFSLFSFSFLSLAHELVHGRSRELLDRIS